MASEHRFLKIVLTGPESSGKTAMAAALAAALGVQWAPEFARHYVAHLGRPYTRADLRQIGAGQRSWERWYADRPAAASADHPFLILDTDWTVLQIWEQYRFGVASDFEWQKGYGTPDMADLYLLCAPDFPWHPDPLREHPEERAVLFDLYERLLSGTSAPFRVLRGDPAARLESALAACRELL